MACESRVYILHVHGHEADIAAFFDAVVDAMFEVVKGIPALYPSVQIIPPEEDNAQAGV